MDNRIQEILKVIQDTAEQIKLEPEDLLVYIGEATVNNCPEIYQALREYSVENGLFE